MESERRRDGEMSSARAAAQAHDRINLLLDRIHELTAERGAARRTAIEEALAEVGNALDGWIEGARSNCEASGHHGEWSGEECGERFAVSDIRAMIDDARQQLATPVVAVEDGGVVPVASVHETPASIEALKRDLRQALAERDEARDERDRWKNAYENAAEAKRAVVERLTVERDAWKRQANDDVERTGLEQQRADEIATELETALRQRDAAHGVIANLRAVLANVVGTLDDLNPNTGQENKS